MLVLDSEGQGIWQQNELIESTRLRRQKELAQDLWSNSVSVANDDRFDVSDLTYQMGNPMTARELKKRLKKCNSRLHFIPSPQFPELTGVYLITDEWEVDSKNNGFQKKLKHICGMESGVMPEFSLLHKRKIKKPNPELLSGHIIDRELDWIEVDTFDGETRGWRTVLVRLLHAGLITMYDIDRNFPPPSRDSYKWYSCTKKFTPQV